MSTNEKNINEQPGIVQPSRAPMQDAERQVRVRFNDRNMASHYANVANVGMIKDEATVLSGTNQNWGTIGEKIVI